MAFLTISQSCGFQGLSRQKKTFASYPKPQYPLMQASGRHKALRDDALTKSVLMHNPNYGF